jgi:hypothetical protein
VMHLLKKKLSHSCEKLLTAVAEEYRQEDESVKRAKKYNTHVHSEVENLEQLRLGKCQHYYAAEFCKRYSTEHLEHKQHTRMHVVQWQLTKQLPY